MVKIVTRGLRSTNTSNHFDTNIFGYSFVSKLLRMSHSDLMHLIKTLPVLKMSKVCASTSDSELVWVYVLHQRQDK